MSIGEVLEYLRHDFPDVSISKLRFLEAEGLVDPARTPAGYRKYSPVDVSRLRFVLAAQRDQYLPLRVIREQLAELDRAAAHSTPAQAGGPGWRPALYAVGSPAEPEPAVHWLSRAELLERTGLTEQTLASLEEYGLLAGHAGAYDTDALAIATAAAALCRYGLQPRHLRGFRTAADREVGLFAQLVTPLARNTSAAGRGRAADTVRELVALSQHLHGALVRAGLRDLLDQ